MTGDSDAAAGDGWLAVLPAGDLPEETPMRVSVEGMSLMLFRTPERIYALANECSHLGGPLDRGRIGHMGAEPTVTCPLHGSLFMLRDGRVLRGPATRPQPVLEARERDGSIEIRDPS